ncbi:PspC domain-containing protein [Elizabethkingia meningoseptica]|uniref:Stress-responsive transcriptional regulator n=1 Tax=Elizabethkingia meningoseptica TaxID=238 RepID=A0A1V3TYI7_ELIME|nr:MULTISPECIES: PspC domain-containing protein [Elizabethkingia]AQX05075.1 stress-responsive transcriptional regulator [Elizabethkingia meningoseptica]AQX12598.1 stress-responsive transcriptional regulator [Elizabethkingia meningoseptica]AQX47119.1 stress-responsive transcriptional regulator [Elizabethkingia meningoseptica]EJK5329409.1 PspC domain-containing protein [Elizabethkingia meningoseptica]EOR30580.1 Putative stress-responsive transcriptional regulator [Elizabethkingia meningoseptica 
MNKTLSIGLAGFSFTIEEHAYIKLNDYLAALRRSMEPEEANEVMQDIEMRIVEIFKGRLGKREVVNDEDVEAVIALIGTPEQIDEQEQEYTAKEKSGYTKSGNGYSREKQLFRDPETKMIGGVSGGLAGYLGVDIVWIRLAFVLLLFAKGFGFLIYVILWIVVPMAKTAGDFLKMRGKPLNFDNLKEQSNKVVQFATDSSEKVNQFYQDNKGQAGNVGNAFLKALAIIFGLFTASIAISFFLGSIAVLFGGLSFGEGAIDIPENINFYFNDGITGSAIIFFGFLSLLIPAIIFTLISLKLFSPNLKIKYMGYLIGALVVCWIVLIGFIGYSASKANFRFNGHNEEVENISITTKSDSIILDSKKVIIPENFRSYISDIYSDKKTIFEETYPYVNIERKEVTAPYLIVEKSANGYNKPLQMKVPVEVVDNKILFPNYISYGYENRFRNYHIEYKLVVPKKMKVVKASGADVSISKDENDDDDSFNGNITINTTGSDEDAPDSIIVNGKKVAVEDIKIGKTQDDKKIKIDKDSIKEVNVSISNGKKEVKIKTR